MTHKLHNSVMSQVEQVIAAEKVTKAVLGPLSRDLLIYTPESDDIATVNRLIHGLSPVNKKAAILFFSHFLPWQVEKDNNEQFVRFGKKMTADKKVKAKLKAIIDFLSEESNTIWTWAENNLEIKKKDFARGIRSAIKKALAGDEKSDTPPLTMKEVVDAIFDSEADQGELILSMIEHINAVEEEKAEEEQQQVA